MSLSDKISEKIPKQIMEISEKLQKSSQPVKKVAKNENLVKNCKNHGNQWKKLRKKEKKSENLQKSWKIEKKVAKKSKEVKKL